MKVNPVFLVLFIVVFNSGVTFAQNNCTCAICGVPCSASASAHTNSSCPVYQNYHSGRSGNASINKTSFEQEIMLNIFSKALNNLFSNNKPGELQPVGQDKNKERLEEEQRQKALAVLLARQKRYNDSVAQASHNRMMKDYKQLDGHGDLKFKTLDDDVWKPSAHFNCKIVAYKGLVTVFKPNGQSTVLSAEQSVDLAPGDWITTGKEGRLKLHYAFETGGEDMILGSNSVLNIVTNEAGANVPKLQNGDMYVVSSNVQEKLAGKTLDVQDELKNEKNRLLEMIKQRFPNKVEVRTPSASCGVRGTEFTVKVDEFENTEVYVTNGIVDLTGNMMNGIITLTAETKGIVKGSGEILGPLQITEKQFNPLIEFNSPPSDFK